jgi:hypothetical protein
MKKQWKILKVKFSKLKEGYIRHIISQKEHNNIETTSQMLENTPLRYNVVEPVTQTNSTASADNPDSEDVVSDIGNNIGDGLQPRAIAEPPVALKEVDNNLHKENKKSINLHNILTFIGLTILLTLIFLSYVFLCELRHKKNISQYINIGTNEGEEDQPLDSYKLII